MRIRREVAALGPADSAAVRPDGAPTGIMPYILRDAVRRVIRK
jgi:hypothetical protein